MVAALRQAQGDARAASTCYAAGVDADSQPGNDDDETLEEALEILDEDPAVPEAEKEAEATEEVGTVLGDFA